MKRFATRFLTLKRQITVLSTVIVCSLVSTSLAQTNASFPYGVASGDPYSDSVVLWTKFAPAGNSTTSQEVTWQISTSRTNFSSPVASGTFQATTENNFTVKLIAPGLQAGTEYFYRFTTNGGAAISPVGRTKTLSTGSVDSVRLALFSCSNITADPFYAYDKVARKGDFDALVHVGDYIYEYGPGGYSAAESLAASVGFEPNGELLTLADYRARYAQYHRQNSLQSARASAPLIAIWDDHETANDAYKDGAQNHTEGTEGTWSNRVTAALQAYYEWMPIREPGSGNRKEAYRSFDFGNLVSLHMLETRLTGRDKQISLAPTSADVQARIGQILSSPTLIASYASTYGLTPPASQSDLPTFGAALATPVANELVYANVVEMYSGNRTLLGATQLGWLQNEMATSNATYQVLGQQVLMGNMVMPAELLLQLAGGTVNPATIAKYLTPVAKLAAGMPFNSLNATEQAVYTNANALPYNEDAWDGYGKDRETILQTALSLNKKLFVFSGDTHNAWSNQLKTMSPTSAGLAPQGTVAGIELATPGVSAPGIEKYFPGQEDILRQLFLGYSPGLKFANLANRGFLDVTFTPEKVLAKFYLKQTGAGQKDWKVQPIEIASSTPTTISINATTTEENDYRLQVLHASDMEADVVSLETAPRFAALVDKLEDSTEVDASVTIAAGDTFIPGAFLSAGNDATTKDSLKFALGQLFGFNANGTATDLRESAGRPDIAILNAIGFDATCIGNHEFDLGSTEFASIILPDVRSGGLSKLRHYGASFPYLSANLDFSAVPSTESALAARTTSSVLPVSRFRANPSTDSTYVSLNATHIAQHPKIAKSAIIERGTQKIGVLGVTPPDLANISSPGSVRVTGPQGATLTSPRTYDLDALAAHLQPVINDLKTNGCNKIILATQLQQIENEKGLASKLDGVDIIVAGGSGTIYANDSANLLPGDTAAGTYPYLTTDKGNRTVAVVSTDGQYQYLGRLLVDFNANGEIVGTGGDTIPATAAKVTSVWGSDTNLPYAAGTRGGTVKALTDAIGAVINSKDGLILGKSSVYLEGRRTAVRQQETNFGNLSADANLWYAKQYDATTRVSLKNGGGIRNAIGSTSANGTLQPTKANLTANKTAGDISRLDVEDSLKFNNALTVLTVKASQLKMLLEHGVAGSNGSGADKNTPGQFSQLGGLVAAADLSRTAQTYTSSNNVISAVNAGDRIRYVALTDAQGNPTDVIVANGQVLEPDRLIRMVTLNFLANAGSNGSDFGGDNYPFPYISRVNGVESYDRKDLNSGTLTPALPGNFPALSAFAGNGTEQDAFAEYLLAFHRATPFGIADNTVDLDRRISQITSGSAPRIDAIPKTAVAQTGVPFSYLLTASNYATAFSSSTLPSWLTLNSTTGLLSGTPPSWGFENLIVTASNGNGTGTATFELYIAPDSKTPPSLVFRNGVSLPVGGEISSYANGTVLTTNSGNNAGTVRHGVQVYTLTSNATLEDDGFIDLSSVFGGVSNISSVTSVVADSRGFGVASIVPTGVTQNNLGKIAIFDTNTGDILKTFNVGYHPDCVVLTPDKTKILVANEGEYNASEAFARPGSLSVIDISSVKTIADIVNLTQSNVATFDFQDFNLATGVTLRGVRDNTLAMNTANTTAGFANIEAEYVTATNTQAYVTLQENNAIATFDFATKKFTRIANLGTVTQTVDASDQDGPSNGKKIDINDTVTGLPMPDTMVSFTKNGILFLVTANEGDARPDDGDIARGSAIITANLTSSNATTVINAGLTRLSLLKNVGDIDGDGKIDQPTMMGTRSFTIWNAATGNRTYDSGSAIETYVANNNPLTFNINSGNATQWDTRSDDKGPEPEALAYGSVAGRDFVFVGNERENGVIAFDITNTADVKVAGYFNTVTNTSDSGGSFVSPESISFVPGDQNPTRKNLLIVGYEGTGTNGSLAVFEFRPPISGNLTITSNGTASGRKDQPFNYAITANMPVISYSMNGTLPTGLTFDSTTGVITGTPTVSSNTTANVILSVTASVSGQNGTLSNATATKPLLITIAGTALPGITSNPTASGTQGSPFSFTVAASNGPNTYSLTGALPTGLTFNATSGVIAGTPSVVGNFTVGLTARNSAGNSAVQPLAIQIAAAQAPTVSIATIDAGAFEAFNTQVTPTLTANATNAVKYQWSFNGKPIAGATSSTYNIGPAATTKVGNYSVAVTNAGNQTVTSNSIAFALKPAAILAISAGNQSLTQGYNAVYASGSNATFSADLTNTFGNATYQWFRNGVAITTNGTSANYTIPSITANSTGSYRVQVTTKNGTTTIGTVVSPEWVVSLSGAPEVTNPGNLAAFVGSPFSFNATVTGNASSLTINGTLPAGLTYNATARRIAGTPTTVGNFPIRLTPFGNATTGPGAPAAFNLVVSNPPTPVISIMTVNGNGTSPTVESLIGQAGPAFQVVVSNSENHPLKIQWRFNGLPIVGANATTYNVGITTAAKTGVYDVLVTNAAGVSTASRQVRFAPGSVASFSILGGGNQFLAPGNSTTFTLGNLTQAIPTASESIQWIKNGVAIAGATGSSYTTNSTGIYAVTVTSTLGSTILGNVTSTSWAVATQDNSAGILVYNITGNATRTSGSTETTGNYTGYMVVDRINNNAAFIQTYTIGFAKRNSLEDRPDIAVASTGPVVGSRTVFADSKNETPVVGEYIEHDLVWITGRDAENIVAPATTTPSVQPAVKVFAPAMMTGIAGMLIRDGASVEIDSFNVTLTLNNALTANAYRNNQTLEGAIESTRAAATTAGFINE